MLAGVGEEAKREEELEEDQTRPSTRLCSHVHWIQLL